MVVADAGDFGDVIVHSQFTIDKHTKVTHSINRRDTVSSNMKTSDDALKLFAVGVSTKPDDFCFRWILAKTFGGALFVHSIHTVLHLLYGGANVGQQKMILENRFSQVQGGIKATRRLIKSILTTRCKTGRPTERKALDCNRVRLVLRLARRRMSVPVSSKSCVDRLKQ